MSASRGLIIRNDRGSLITGFRRVFPRDDKPRRFVPPDPALLYRLLPDGGNGTDRVAATVCIAGARGIALPRFRPPSFFPPCPGRLSFRMHSRRGLNYTPAYRGARASCRSAISIISRGSRLIAARNYFEKIPARRGIMLTSPGFFCRVCGIDGA